MAWHSRERSAKASTTIAICVGDGQDLLALPLQECQPKGREGRAARQFWAPPMPRRASVKRSGFSTTCENRTTVTVSSIVTGLP